MKSVMATNRLRVLVLLPLVWLCPAFMQAQTIALRINEIDITQFPAVRLKVEVIHEGTSSFNPAAALYAVLENNVPQKIERVDCANDTTTRLSIALLIDRSGSMADKVGPFGWPIPDPDSTKIRSAKAAVGTFVSRLGGKDEAALFSFSSPQSGSTFFQVNQDFTKDTIALRNALVPIKAGGGTHIWKAIRETVARIRNRSGRRYIIVLTDGQSSRGDDPIQSAINDAVAAKIPVYTIGLGGDVSTNELTDIANRTGGKYYRAPDASTLEAIYLELAKIILTDGCEIRYISSNPCLDGTRRELSVSVTGSGHYADVDTFYTVQRNLTQYTLALDASIPVTAGDQVQVPVYVREFVSDLEPLSFDITVAYDTTFLMFPRPIVDGTMCERAVVSQTEAVPGTLRYQLQNYFPSTTSGVVFMIEFLSRVTRRDTTTPLALANVQFAQQCPTDLTLVDGSVSITHCNADYVLSTDSILIGMTGGSVTVPVRMSPPPRAGEFCKIGLHVRSDPSTVMIDGILSDGTISESMRVSSQRISDADFVLSFEGVPVDTGGAFFLLKCSVPWRKESVYATIELSDLIFESRCVTTISADPVFLLIDGACERISTIRPVKQIVVNTPNPFNPVTRVRFAVKGGHVRLWIADEFGRLVTTLADRNLREGEYDVVFDGSSLASGTYFAILEHQDNITVRRMILLR